VLINQTLDSEWFRILGFMGLVAFALSGVLLAYEGQYTLFGAVMLAVLPAVGGGVVRDVLLQREPIGIVRDPAAILIVFATVIAGMIVIKSFALIRADRAAKYLKSHGHLATGLIETFDAVGLAATVVGVVVALDTLAQPLLLWSPIAAAITASFGGLIRDVFRNDCVGVNLRGELYPEIAAVWGLRLPFFWNGRASGCNRTRSE
jgi:polar amino acid transport system substrate-binding protein